MHKYKNSSNYYIELKILYSNFYSEYSLFFNKKYHGFLNYPLKIYLSRNNLPVKKDYTGVMSLYKCKLYLKSIKDIKVSIDRDGEYYLNTLNSRN